MTTAAQRRAEYEALVRASMQIVNYRTNVVRTRHLFWRWSAELFGADLVYERLAVTRRSAERKAARWLARMHAQDEEFVDYAMADYDSRAHARFIDEWQRPASTQGGGA